MDPALEEIEFLALSSNRVAVLDALREGTHTRRELEAATGASQPTLGRILRDFDERNWVRRGEDGYEATATGRLVATGITELAEIVETELKLRDVAEWLPTEEFEFDLLALRDATITVPTQTRPSAPVQRVSELLERADDVRIVSYAFNEQSLEIVRRRALEGGGGGASEFEPESGSETGAESGSEFEFRGVFSASAIDALAEDPQLRRRLRDLVAADRAEIRSHEADLPLAVTITDRAVQLLLRDDDGVLQAAVDTDDPRVRSWADDVHERYWADATPLTADALEDAE